MSDEEKWEMIRARLKEIGFPKESDFTPQGQVVVRTTLKKACEGKLLVVRNYGASWDIYCQ